MSIVSQFPCLFPNHILTGPQRHVRWWYCRDPRNRRWSVSRRILQYLRHPLVPVNRRLVVRQEHRHTVRRGEHYLHSSYAGHDSYTPLLQLYTPNGRGFPDIAAQAENVEIFNGGNAYLIGGTSCATPIFASTIALINDNLVAAGKSPLGFLNPWLYANTGALNDITSGKSKVYHE